MSADGNVLAQTGSASGFNPCETPTFDENHVYGIAANGGGNTVQDVEMFSC